MIFGVNTTRNISKLSQISLAYRLVKLSVTILKYHSWYLCQISLQIMLLPILILLYEKLLQFDWLRAVVFQLNLKYLHVKITKPLRVVV